MRESLDRFTADLRGEIQTLAGDLRGEMQTVAGGLRGEIQTLAGGLRGEMQTLAGDLRGEILTSAAETRAYVDERIHDSATNLLHQMRQQMGETESRMRRHFEVVGESLRGEIRSVAELVALSNEQRDRRDDEQAVRSDRLEGRVQRLEVDVSRLKAGQKPRRPRRR